MNIIAITLDSTKQLNLVRKQFNKRAKSYKKYTKWVGDPLLFELCIEPLKEMKLSSKCLDLGGGTGWLHVFLLTSLMQDDMRRLN